MYSTSRGVLIFGALAVLAGCATREVGYEVRTAGFGTSVESNNAAQLAFGGDRRLAGLYADFRRSVPDMVHFAFNSASLDQTAQRILDQQASWIIRHPEVRLRIYGNTDLVGSAAYNRRLGQMRANAVAAYLTSRGISPTRLEAVVSLGETQPLILTSQPEVRNRRTVTEVVGYAMAGPGQDFDGKRAALVYHNYVTGEGPRPSSLADAVEVYVGGE